MGKCVSEATDENVLQSIRDNTYMRSEDVKGFIEGLDLIDGNYFISIDAKWGNGKTFFVRQVEKTLDYLTRVKFREKASKYEDSFFEKNPILNRISIKHSYLPIYYNAWLYDNHDDPLMSLVLEIVKHSDYEINTEIDTKKLGNKVWDLMEVLKIPIASTLKKVKDKLTEEDILSSVKTAEDIRNCVKNVFDEIINESAQRLVIIIDELDRCKPSFAMEMLERIKHYFDDERIIVIVSVNKEQLIHTISKYYGEGFDSTGYLNKFFDCNMILPDIRDDAYISNDDSHFYLDKIADDLILYYNLSLRDSLIYKNKIRNLPKGNLGKDNSSGYIITAFLPVIIVLEMKNQPEKMKFLNGKSEIIDIIANDVPSYTKFAIRISAKFQQSNVSEKEIFEDGLSILKALYSYIFGNIEEKPEEIQGWTVTKNTKRECLKYVNMIDG